MKRSSGRDQLRPFRLIRGLEDNAETPRSIVASKYHPNDTGGVTMGIQK